MKKRDWVGIRERILRNADPIFADKGLKGLMIWSPFRVLCSFSTMLHVDKLMELY